MNHLTSFIFNVVARIVGSIIIIFFLTHGDSMPEWFIASPIWTAKICLLLFITVLWLLIEILLQKRKYCTQPILKDYDFIEYPGVARHIKTGEFYCYKCLINGKKSYLSIVHKKGYSCRNCGDIIFPFKNWDMFIKFRKKWKIGSP